MREKSPSPLPQQTARRSSNVKKRVKQILSIVLGRRRPGFLPRTLARARVNNVTHVAWTELRRSGASRVPLAPAVALRFPATSVATLFYRCARGFREAGGSAARGPARAGARPAANGRPRAIARCLGSRSSPGRGPARDRSRPRGSTRAIVPRRPPQPLAASSGEWTARGGGRLGLGRARRPRPGRRSRTTARDGRRIHADTAAPAPSAVARAPPSPARRRSRVTPNLDPRRSRPASRDPPRYPSRLTSPAHQNSRSADFTHRRTDPARDRSRARAHTHDGLRRTRAAGATR